MFSFFRRGATAKIMLVILGLALFAMVVTGFGTGGSGLGGLGGLGDDTLAEAGDEKVTALEVTDTMNRQLTRMREQQPELDMASFIRMGAFDDIVRQMISSAAVLSFGRDAGITASKRMVDAEIARIPAFQNFAGEFDQATFQAALARQNLTEAQLREELATGLIQQQIFVPLAASAQVPESMALQYASLLLERRTGSIGAVPADAVPEGPAPTDAEIAAFYQQNKGSYTIPERRVLRYAVLGPEQVAGAAQPTDAEIAAFYRANAARYAAQETRTLSQVVLPTQQAAQTFAAKVARGTSFAQAAAEAGFSAADTRVGERSRAQFADLTSQAVANAAFGAAEGAVTAPTQSDFGWHVVRVEGISRTEARPLAAVQDEIRQQLREQKAQEALADTITRIEDALADGESLAEVAAANNLTVRETPPVTGAGAAEGAELPPEVAPLLRTAFDMAADEEPVVETLGEGQRFAILSVSRIIPASPPPLAQIRDRVRQDFIARRALNRAREIAQQIVTRINGGATPAQAFAQAGISLPPIQSVDARRLDIAQNNGQVPPPLQMLFSMKKGTAKLQQAPNGVGWFVVHLAETEAGDASDQPQLVQATRAQFSQAVGQEFVEQFVNAVERRVEVERNEEAIAAVKQQLQGPSGL